MSNNFPSLSKPTLLKMVDRLTRLFFVVLIAAVIVVMVLSSGDEHFAATPKEIVAVGILFLISFLFQGGGVTRLHRIVLNYEKDLEKRKAHQDEAGDVHKKKAHQDEAEGTHNGPPAWQFYSLCLWSMLFCLIFNIIILCWYASGRLYSGGQYVTLGLIFLLLSPAIGITYIIMESSEDEDADALNKMKSSVSTAPYWALLFFMGLFLNINYLFSFAFAFHDRSVQNDNQSDKSITALYMQPLPEPATARQQPSSAGQQSSLIGNDSFQFSFELRTAQLSENQTYDVGKSPDDLVNKVVENLKSGKSIILELKGQADDLPIRGTRYLSNYELSEARALRVKSRILEKLYEKLQNDQSLKELPDKGWHNIEWHYVPLSDDVGENSKATRTVEVKLVTFQDQLLPPQKLPLPYKFRLMDYVLYTITGADYGDVVPTTPYAKFLASFVNIIQIFFLVALFSAVLTLQKQRQPKFEEHSGAKIDKLIEDLLSKVDDPVCAHTAMMLHDSDGIGSVNVTAPSSASWKAEIQPVLPETEKWIWLSSRESGSGSGTIEYSFKKNEGVSSRKAQIIIETTISEQLHKQILAINQAGRVHFFSIFPTRKFFNADGGDDKVEVDAPEGYPWRAESHDDWIIFPSSNAPAKDLIGGSGNALVSYRVKKNDSTKTRRGAVTIAGHTFTIVQEKSTCNYELSPTEKTKTFFTIGGEGEIEVITKDGCKWVAESNRPWIEIIDGKSGSKSGTVKYIVKQNDGSSERKGAIVIAGQVFTIYQWSRE